jgi:hypothetical protein
VEERLKSARLKVEWAEKHMLQIHDMFLEFSRSDFYSMRVEEDSEEKTHSLRIDIDLRALNVENCALIIGDVLHNLRSALDHLYYQVVLGCDGTPTTWTHFPVFESSQKLAGWINGAVGRKQITTAVATLLLNSIRPYKGGNHALWRLHELNNLDKHEIIVPVLELVGFLDV